MLFIYHRLSPAPHTPSEYSVLKIICLSNVKLIIQNLMIIICTTYLTIDSSAFYLRSVFNGL